MYGRKGVKNRKIVFLYSLTEAKQTQFFSLENWSLTFNFAQVARIGEKIGTKAILHFAE